MKNILIIEDDLDIVETTKFYLEKKGFVCWVKEDGESALEQIKITKPDLIILDIMLPKMSGYDVAIQLKNDEKYKTIPIVILTAKLGEDQVKASKEIGVEEYLVKPFDMPELLKYVQKHTH